MSGGHFDYNQYRIRDIADSIEQVIKNNNKEKPKEAKNYFDSDYYYQYPPEVIEKFKEGLAILKQAEVYAQRIDWLLSGDDGNKTFLERLKEDLDGLTK